MQYTLLIPLMQFFSPTLIVGLFGVVLLVFFFMKNNLRRITNYNVLALYFVLCFLFIIKVFLTQASIKTILYFVLFTFPSVCIFVFPFSYKTCIDYLIKLSRVGFFLIFWIPFFFEYNYMRFGYGMLPVVILSFISIVYLSPKEKDKTRKLYLLLDLAIMLLGFAEMLICGARGCIFALLLFIVIDRFLVNKQKIIRNTILLLIAVVSYLNIVPLLNLAENIANRLGIYSYAITKFKMQIMEGFANAASGRMKIYARSIAKIRSSPLFGGEIGLNETGGEYAHNLFLQVGEDFGVIAVIVLAAFILYTLYVIGRSKLRTEPKLLLTLLFSTSIGRLMFSSTIWRRPEFWMLVCVILTLKRNMLCNHASDTLSESNNRKQLFIEPGL